MNPYRQHDAETAMFISRNRESAGDAAHNVWLADWKKHGLPYCTVYVISPDNNWPCKVGISVAPRKRITSLQVSCWRPLKVDYSVWCPTIAEARALENAMHEVLTEDGKWLSGEWFDMRAEHALDLLHFKASVCGIECHDTIKEPIIVKEAEAALYHFSQCGLFDRLPNRILTA